MPFKCRMERDELVSCMEKCFYDEELKNACIEEYLNERSHYRQTGT